MSEHPEGFIALSPELAAVNLELLLKLAQDQSEKIEMHEVDQHLKDSEIAGLKKVIEKAALDLIYIFGQKGIALGGANESSPVDRLFGCIDNVLAVVDNSLLADPWAEPKEGTDGE